MLTSAQLRKRALRRKRDAIHAGERRRDQRDGFWDDLFRATGDLATGGHGDAEHRHPGKNQTQ